MLAAVTLLLQVAVGSPVPADAYADSATRALVAEARAARERTERLVTAYRVRASQRIGIGIRALARDRMLWRQELVADLHWRRDSISTATVVGARESAPIAERGDRLPEGLRSDVTDLMIDPASDYLRVIGAEDDDGFLYPLRPGGESDYRFAIGGVAQFSLPDGRQIRIVALAVTPRRADWRLISGTLWFDADTKGLVRAAFRPARPFELRRDLAEEDDVPGWVNATGEVRFVTLEYGLYESRWWLPRYVAIDAVGSMGRWLDVPFKIERVYQDYEVEGGTPPDPTSSFIPAGRSRWVTRDGVPLDSAARAEVRDSVRREVRACLDAAQARIDSTLDNGAVLRAERAACRERHSTDNFTLVVPTDTNALLAAPELGEPILQMGDVISEQELGSLRTAIENLPDRPWEQRVELPAGVGALLRNARYNRIEGLSLGLGGAADFGRLRLEGTARIGLADGEPNGELAVVRGNASRRIALTAYRRLAAANPSERPLGAINSAMSLLAGRDDGEYFRSRGIELTVEGGETDRWGLRLWHQRETAARVETDASLPALFDGDRVFRDNIVADRHTSTGGSLVLRASRPLSPTVALGAELHADGTFGDREYGRGAIVLRAFLTPPTRLSAAVSLAAGTSRGDVPVQSRFFLGGSGSLRGYPGGTAAGEAYWLLRAEVGNGFPAVRLVGFADVGWAGSRAAFGKGSTLAGVGIGGSFLDGLLRIDVAHGLKEPGGTRIEVYVDGML